MHEPLLEEISLGGGANDSYGACSANNSQSSSSVDDSYQWRELTHPPLLMLASWLSYQHHDKPIRSQFLLSQRVFSQTMVELHRLHMQKLGVRVSVSQDGVVVGRKTIKQVMIHQIAEAEIAALGKNRREDYIVLVMDWIFAALNLVYGWCSTWPPAAPSYNFRWIRQGIAQMVLSAHLYLTENLQRRSNIAHTLYENKARKNLDTEMWSLFIGIARRLGRQEKAGELEKKLNIIKSQLQPMLWRLPGATAPLSVLTVDRRDNNIKLSIPVSSPSIERCPGSNYQRQKQAWIRSILDQYDSASGLDLSQLMRHNQARDLVQEDLRVRNFSLVLTGKIIFGSSGEHNSTPRIKVLSVQARLASPEQKCKFIDKILMIFGHIRKNRRKTMTDKSVRYLRVVSVSLRNMITEIFGESNLKQFVYEHLVSNLFPPEPALIWSLRAASAKLREFSYINFPFYDYGAPRIRFELRYNPDDNSYRGFIRANPVVQIFLRCVRYDSVVRHAYSLLSIMESKDFIPGNTFGQVRVSSIDLLQRRALAQALIDLRELWNSFCLGSRYPDSWVAVFFMLLLNNRYSASDRLDLVRVWRNLKSRVILYDALERNDYASAWYALVAIPLKVPALAAVFQLAVRSSPFMRLRGCKSGKDRGSEIELIVTAVQAIVREGCFNAYGQNRSDIRTELNRQYLVQLLHLKNSLILFCQVPGTMKRPDNVASFAVRRPYCDILHSLTVSLRTIRSDYARYRNRAFPNRGNLLSYNACRRLRSRRVEPYRHEFG